MSDATRERVVVTILLSPLAQVLLVIVIGVPLTLGLARLLRSRLFGVL